MPTQQNETVWRKAFRLGLLVILVAGFSPLREVQAHGGAETKQAEATGPTQDAELAEIRARFAEHKGSLDAAIWTLIHVYDSKDEVERFIKVIEAFLRGAEVNPEGPLNGVGSAHDFKEQLAGFLGSSEESVCAAAAIFLGATGDLSYAPKIAAILKERQTQGAGELEPICRGRAATALGLMGAQDFAPDLAELLASKNFYERQGAVLGLGLLKATEYAGRVAEFLPIAKPPKGRPEENDEVFDQLRQEQDDSAIVSLVEMGVGADYTEGIAKVLHNPYGTDVKETAMYALAELHAKKHIPDIARLLTEEFQKGDAAKALALLDAHEYSNEIGALLQDKEPLVRKDAAIALGILGASEHAPQVAGLLRDEEEFVRYYAAMALVLMGAQGYKAEAVPIINSYHAQGYYFNAGDLHPIVSDRFLENGTRFQELLKKWASPPQ